MKHLYITIIVSIISHLSSQSQIIDNWYLKSVTTNGHTYANIFGNLPMNFTNTIDYDGVSYLFNGESSCNGIFGSYTFTNSEITFNNVGQTLVDCFTDPRQSFENIYIPILNNNNTNPSTFFYLIEGAGDSQILTLTNTNGDSIIYTKSETNTALFMIWFLNSFTDDGITYSIPASSQVNIDFTYESGYPTSIAFNGVGVCNTFDGNYDIYLGSGDQIDILNFIPTQNTCNPPSDFETAYFSALSSEPENIFNFEIINNGTNLILTSAASTDRSPYNNTTFTFVSEPLSIEEHTTDYNFIRLVKNPVSDVLSINYNSQLEDLKYSIFDITGEQIKSAKVNSNDEIDVQNLDSGVYFITFTKDSNALKTIKFIKR